MSAITIERCPETGICSIVKAGSGKLDLMPDEVVALQQAGANLDRVREIVAEANSTLAAGLSADDLTMIVETLT